MHLQVTFVAFALCSTLFCSTTGAPAGESATGESSESREKVIHLYSRQEDKFIIEEALKQAQEDGKISWKRIAEMIEDQVNNKVFGFNHKRMANNLKQHFRKKMLKKRISDGKSRGYTEQEEKFINKELLNDSFRSHSLYGDEIWGVILERHNLKREQNCDGFSIERSLGGLRHHFLRNMRPGHRVSKEVKARFLRNFKGQEVTSNCAENFNEETQPDCGAGPSEYHEADIFMQDVENVQNSVDDERADDFSLFEDEEFLDALWKD